MASSTFWLPIITTLLVLGSAVGLTLWSWQLEAQGEREKALWFSRAAWAVLGLIALATLVVLGRQQRLGRLTAEKRFEDAADRMQHDIEARLQTYEDLLKGCAQFLTAQHPDPTLWSRYIDSLNLSKAYPNIYGLGYAAHVPYAELSRFLENARRSRTSWAIFPPGERFDYFVVQLMEPLSRNKGLLGYDLGSELSARTAAERARETGAAALTGKMILLDNPDDRSFLLFSPLARDRDNFQGWTFLRFRQEDLLKGLPSVDGSPIRLQVFDGPIRTKDTLFFNNTGSLANWNENDNSPFSMMRVITVGGRPWTLSFSADRGFGSSAESSERTFIGLLGMGLCVGGGGFLWAFTSSRRRAANLAQRLTTQFREREKALAAGPHGLMIADATQPDNPLLYVNARFERLTGYSASDVLGQNPRFLYRDDADQKGLDDIRRALKEQTEVRVLLRNYRRDGTPFWNDLFISPVWNDQGRLSQWVGVLQDVTEREQADRRLATQVTVLRALSEAPSINEAMPNILQAICESQGWDLGTFWRLDPRANVLRCSDVWRPRDLEAGEFERFVRETTYPKEMGLPGLVWAKSEPLWFSNVLKEGNFPEASLIAKQGLTGACGFPVTGAHGLLGVLTFYSRHIWPLNKNLLLLMAGTASRISQELEAERAVVQQRELTVLERGMAEFLGEGLLAMDREGFCIYANQTAGKLLGISPKHLLGQSLPDRLQPTGLNGNDLEISPLRKALQSTRPEYYPDGQFFRRVDGGVLPVALTTSPILDQGLIQGVVVTFVDSSSRLATFEEHRRSLEAKDREIQDLQNALREVQQAVPASPKESGKRLTPELLARLRDLLNEIS